MHYKNKLLFKVNLYKRINNYLNFVKIIMRKTLKNNQKIRIKLFKNIKINFYNLNNNIKNFWN